MGGSQFLHVISPSTSADPPVHLHRPRPYRHAVANVSAWSWARLLQLGMLVLLLLAVLAAVSVVFGLLLKQLGRCLKRRRRKALVRNFNRSPEAGSTAPLFEFSPRMSSGQCNLGSSLGNSFRCGGQRFPTIQVVEYPANYGAVPQIQVLPSDIEDTNNLSAYSRPLSSMSNVIMPPWTESRSSLASILSHISGSPSSFISSTHTFFASSSGNPDEAPVQSGDCGRPSEWRFWHRLAGRYKAQQVIERQRFLGRLQQQFLPGVEPPHVSNDLIMGNISMENSRKAEKVRFEEGREDEAACRFEQGLIDKTAISSCFRGTLTYQLRYDFIHRVLMLHVRRANNLPITDGAPDPYVKMYCLPERRNHWKTSIFKKSVDPEFNEMFSFDIPYNELAHRMLQFTVYDFDRFTRHGLIGNVIMRDLFEKSDLYNWTEFTMPIVGSQEKNDYGDLLLYLAYSADLCKLYLTVAKAYNLRPMDITGASDPYVKCEQIYQRKRVKMRKTSIKRANLNPVYHECLEFDLPINQIKDTSILVQVMDWDRIGRDDLLGCCVLGNDSPTPEGRTQWMQCFTLVYGNNLPQAASTDQLQTLSNGETRLDVGLDLENGIKENGNELEPNGISLRELRGKYSVASLGSNGNPIGMQCFDAALRPIGTWHSILGEVPDSYRNIPKAKRK